MTFRSLSDSIFTDALSSLEMSLLGNGIDAGLVKGIVEYKKAFWIEMEQKNAEFWLKEGIKYAMQQGKVELNDIKVIIDPYSEHINRAISITH